MSLRFFFFLVQAFIINKYIDNNNIILNKDSSKYKKEIADCLFKLKDEELKKGFWEIINYYNLDYLGILSNTNGYKEKLFPVSNIFNWLVNEDFYCIKRKKM